MQMDFPHRKPISLNYQKIWILYIKPNEVLKARDYVLVYEDEEQIKNIEINKELFDQINLDPGGVVITAGEVNQILFQDILFLNVLFLKISHRIYTLFISAVLSGVLKKNQT